MGVCRRGVCSAPGHGGGLWGNPGTDGALANGAPRNWSNIGGGGGGGARGRNGQLVRRAVSSTFQVVMGAQADMGVILAHLRLGCSKRAAVVVAAVQAGKRERLLCVMVHRLMPHPSSTR
jgi:hypothetical protein